MPPRPHPIVLTVLVAGCMFVLLLMLPGALAHASAAGAPTWRWPLRGPVEGSFHLTPVAPFARGQRRGIDVAAAAGSIVRSACPGRVTFAGAVPRFGLAVSVRCGALVATYLRLGHLRARRGARVRVGAPLGTLGPAGLLRIGARQASDRRGYVDPLSLLRDPRPAAPRVLAAPRRRHPHPLVPHPARPRVRVAPRAARGPAALAAPRRRHPHLLFPHPARPRVRVAPRAARGPAALAAPRPAAPAVPPHAPPLPWLAYPALALIASALPLGGLVRRRRRRARSLTAAAAHEGP